ncbi:hypothetical protein OXX80_002085 [Metschnikowia pulcherrima]
MAKIHFIALISRDDRPLYIQSLDQVSSIVENTRNTENTQNLEKLDHETKESDLSGVSPSEANTFLKYNFLSHMALDVFASPMSLHLREQQGASDGVLLLFIQDDVTVYGMETNNGLKLVVGASTEIVFREKLKNLFSQIHRAYLKTVCNPFTDVSRDGDYDKMLHTHVFDKRIKNIVKEWDSE